MGKLAILAVAAAMLAPAQGISANDDGYLDDRTNAAALVVSYYNAINAHEYARAWSYWGDGAEGRTYEEFAEGFFETAHVTVIVGEMISEGAAGSAYTQIAVAIEATGTDGSVRAYAGCYLTRIGMPSAQEPPFEPLHFERGYLRPVSGYFASALPGSCEF